MRKLLVLVSLIFILCGNSFAFSTEHFVNMFNESKVPGITIEKFTGKLVYANGSALDFYGYDAEEISKLNIDALRNMTQSEVKIQKIISKDKGLDYIVANHIDSKGKVHVVREYASEFTSSGNAYIFITVIDGIEQPVGIFEMLKKSSTFIVSSLLALAAAITALSYKAYKRHRRNSFTDALTGAYSRRFLNQFMKVKEKNDCPNGYTSILVDMDDFKIINDTYGHHVGDEVLKNAVVTFKSFIRKADHVIRLGGDEFMIILVNCSKERAKEIMVSVTDKLKYNSKFEFPVKFSYGIEEFEDKAKLYESMKLADVLLYEQKKKKKMKR